MITLKKYASTGKIIIFIFLLAGVICTFAYKLQSIQYVSEGEHHHKDFFHPYMQTFTMFIGQSLCLIVFFVQRKKNRLLLQQGKTEHNRFIFAIPALSDALSSILQYMGLAFLNSSTYMMFKGTAIVTTLLFSVILMKIKVQKKHIVGCTLAVIGLAVVGSSSFINKSNNDNAQKQMLGYVLMIISLIFNGFFYAFQGKLLKQHTIHPFEMVGFQGIFGICYLTIILITFSYIPCTFGEKYCVYNDQNQSFMQLPLVYLKEIGNILMIFLVIIGIISIAVFNFTGAFITKLYDPLTRALLNVTKTTVIWIIGIIVAIAATTKQYQLEQLNILVNLVKFVGFICIVMGTLIYNQLIFKSYFSNNQRHKLSILVHDSVNNDSDFKGLQSNEVK